MADQVSPAMAGLIEGKPAVSCSHWGMFHYPRDERERQLRSAINRIGQIALANA
jgi:hypothetical protein